MEVLQTDLCPPLIIEATLLKESARNANVSDGCATEREREREREKEIPVPISPGRSAQRKRSGKPVGLIHLPSVILPTAGIPSSSSHSRLKPMLEYGSWGHFGRESGPRGRGGGGGGWRERGSERGGLGRRRRSSWPCVSAVGCAGASAARTLPPSPLGTHSLHLPSVFLSVSFWHGRSLRYSPA